MQVIKSEEHLASDVFHQSWREPCRLEFGAVLMKNAAYGWVSKTNVLSTRSLCSKRIQKMNDMGIARVIRIGFCNLLKNLKFETHAWRTVAVVGQNFQSDPSLFTAI